MRGIFIQECLYINGLIFSYVQFRKPRTYEGVLKNLKPNSSAGQILGDVINIDNDQDETAIQSFATAEKSKPSLILVPMSSLQSRVTPTSPKDTFSPSNTHNTATPKITQPLKADAPSKVIEEVTLDDSDDDEVMVVDAQPAIATAASVSAQSDRSQTRCKLDFYLF